MTERNSFLWVVELLFNRLSFLWFKVYPRAKREMYKRHHGASSVSGKFALPTVDPEGEVNNCMVSSVPQEKQGIILGSRTGSLM